MFDFVIFIVLVEFFVILVDFFIFIFVIFVIFIIHCVSNHGQYRSFLIGWKFVENGISVHSIAMAQFGSISAFDVSIAIVIIFHDIAVLYDISNMSSGISRCQYERNFSDHAVHNISAYLLKLVSINRQRCNITMTYQFSRVISHFGIIEISVCVHAFGSVFQLGMAKNIKGLGVIVIPYKRNRHAIAVLKRILHNCSSIGAFKIVLGRPT